METRASYLVVGGFVLVSLIALVVMVIWLAGTTFDEEFAYYDILFEGSEGCESRMAVMSAAWFVEFRQRLPWLVHVD